MSSEFIGMLVGAAIGFAGFVALRHVADRIEDGAVDETRRRSARILRLVAGIDLLFFTGVGYFLGPIVLGPTTV